MLKSLLLSNFAGFPSADFTWSPGLNLIVGENGTGKSLLMKMAYSLGEVSANMSKAPRQGMDEWQRRIADKLRNTCRPDYLGRLVSRQQGRNRCEVKVDFSRLPGAEYTFSFATNARTEVKLESLPTAFLSTPPVFIPTREMLSIFPGFISAYEDRHLEFDETYYDVAKALGGIAFRNRTAPELKLIQELESLMGGQIKLENGRFFLHPRQSGKGAFEMHLVAEGVRKIAMLAYLLINGKFRTRCTLFWDEPESNLNPRLIKSVAAALVALVQSGHQVICATHSLFLLREIEILKAREASPPAVHYIGLSLNDEAVRVEQSDDVAGISTLVLLDEELQQSERYLSLEEPR